MKASMIDIQIENSKDPFMIFQVNVSNSMEEIENIFSNMESLLTPEELSFLANDLISADVSKNVDYIIIKQSCVKQFQKISKKCGLQIKMINMAKQIFDSKNVEEFVSLFGQKDTNPELTQQFFPGIESRFDEVNNIVKMVILSQFNIDDVLDKISEKGIDSLNELNQYILEKESR
jgi:hypothetical protein